MLSLRLFAACLLMLFSVAELPAAWLILQNDTQKILIIQEEKKGAKAIRLLPNESYREFQPALASKSIAISDAAQPMVVLAREKLQWATRNVNLRVVQQHGLIQLQAAK